MRLEACAWSAAAVIALATGQVRADAIGPPPTADDCPRGASSHVLNMMTHSQTAYCAPTLCREGARAPAAGATCEVVELEIGERIVSPPSPGHGAEIPRNAPAPRPVARLAEALRTCDAPDDETPIEANRRSDPFFGMLGGPPISQVPVGCHKLRVWLLPQAPTPVAPAPSPTPTPTTATDPSRSPAPPASSATPPSTSAAGCACTTAPSRAPTIASLAFGLAVAIAVYTRRRRGRRRPA